VTDQEIIDLLAGSPDTGVTEPMFDALGVTEVQLLRLCLAGKIDRRERKLATPASSVVTYYLMD
jgi:hypothetical protein